jgi:hypothetical protein
MGTKQPWQAVIDGGHRLPAGSRQAEEVIHLAHGLSFGRLRSHLSSRYGSLARSRIVCIFMTQ